MAERNPHGSTARFPRRRTPSRFARLRLHLLLAGLLLLGGAAFWVVAMSSLMGVHTVRVEGTRLLTAAQVQQAADVPDGAALARLDVGAIADRVRQLLPVAAVSVQRDWPTGLRIVVTERVAVAAVADHGTLEGMDAEGVLFRHYRHAPKRLPLVRAGDLAATGRAAALHEVATAVSSLQPAVSRKVDHVDVASMDAITLVLRDGDTVVWGSADESTLKAQVLTALLHVRGSHYDVSVPEQPTTAQ